MDNARVNLPPPLAYPSTHDAAPCGYAAYRAVAVGVFDPGPEGHALLATSAPADSDALRAAEAAGVRSTGLAATLAASRPPAALDRIAVRCLLEPEHHVVRVYCEVAAYARAPVATEALAGVQGALLALHDLVQEAAPAARMGSARLLFLEGGAKGLWLHPDGMSFEEHQHYRPSCPPLRARGHRLGEVPAGTGDRIADLQASLALPIPGAAAIQGLTEAVDAVGRMRWTGWQTHPAEVLSISQRPVWREQAEDDAALRQPSAAVET